MKRMIVAAACLSVAASLAVAAAAKSPAITQTAIAGATLGQSASDYKALLGTPSHEETLSQPDGWSKLEFPARKLGVYFADPARGATLITTWNKAYRTAAGIGPCSTIKRLKSAYRKRLKPSKFNTQHGVVYAYTVGKNLIFATNNLTTVQVIGLYNGDEPNANKDGGSLSYAGFISLNETACS